MFVQSIFDDEIYDAEDVSSALPHSGLAGNGVGAFVTGAIGKVVPSIPWDWCLFIALLLVLGFDFLLREEVSDWATVEGATVDGIPSYLCPHLIQSQLICRHPFHTPSQAPHLFPLRSRGWFDDAGVKERCKPLGKR